MKQKPEDPGSHLGVFDYKAELENEEKIKRCKTCVYFVPAYSSRLQFQGTAMSICTDPKNPANQRKDTKAVVFPNSTCDNHEFRKVPELPDMIA